MALSKTDQVLTLKKVTYLHLNHLEMDRVLTALFARLALGGYPSRLYRKFEVTTEEFLREFREHPELFKGFDAHPEIVSRWIETHLMDVVNRGTERQAIAAPRPLHGFTYRFRNPKRSRDYGAAEHLYEMLDSASGRQGLGQKALGHLKAFFFEGHDAATGKPDPGITIDVETQALLALSYKVKRDDRDTTTPRERYPPLCMGAAELLADDIIRLLFYERLIPRSVMVEYIKVLLSFHLALYHLRLFKLLPILVRGKGEAPACGPSACPVDPHSTVNPYGSCPYRIALVVDAGGQPGTPMALLAERSADTHYRRIPPFIKAYYAVRKLNEFSDFLIKSGKVPRPRGQEPTVGDILKLMGPNHSQDREKVFGQRVAGIIEKAVGGTDEDLDPEIKAALDLKLPDFETYIEILVALRGTYHRSYVTDCIDSLLMKKRPGAMVVQGRARNSPRRFVLDSGLLEVLLQVAVLTPDGSGSFYTGELRIDALLTWLRERYGIYVDRLPRFDGFDEPSIADQTALRSNTREFTNRLREIGFYRDLSDAYVTQTVTPRYQISPGGSGGRGISKGNEG